MSIPIPYNTTCDIFHYPNTPPGVGGSGADVFSTLTPDVAGVDIHLRSDWNMGQEPGVRANSVLTWTHRLYLLLRVDIRDAYAGQSQAVDSAGAHESWVCVPDKNGTPFKVVFIEIVALGSTQAYKCVYVDRWLAAGTTVTTAWPTNEL